jgi:hypothetical protein
MPRGYRHYRRLKIAREGEALARELHPNSAHPIFAMLFRGTLS